MGKRARRFGVSLVAGAVVSAMSANVGAQTWNGLGTDDNWSTGANWVGGVAPVNNGTANITIAGTTRLTPVVDVPWSINSLSFDASATSPFSISGGTLTMQGSASISAASNGHILSAPLTLSSSATVDPGGSTLTFSGDMNGPGNLTKLGAGTLQVKHVRAGDLAVSAGTLRVTDNSQFSGTSRVNSVSVGVGAKFDLRDNKLVVRTPGSIGVWTGTNYTGLTGLIGQTYNSDNWDLPGITTSMPDAVLPLFQPYTSLAIAQANEVRSLGSSDTDIWGGQTVTGTDTLVMYTYGGDANLSGSIDIDDYGQIDFNAGIGGVATGWYNGDFDYNGIQDIDDYGIIGFVIPIQGPQFSTSADGSMNVTTVPEPASALLMILPLLLPRRRCAAPM